MLVRTRLVLGRTRFEPAEVSAGVRPEVNAEQAAVRRDRAHRVALLVAHAAAICPLQVTCLHRSVVLWYLLGREGIACSLRLGIRNDSVGGLSAHAGVQDFGAHAWVEHEGEPLHEAADLHLHFSAFSSAVVPVPSTRASSRREAA